MRGGPSRRATVKIRNSSARAVWWSKRFRGLPNSDAKLLYHYFLSCERQNSAGCFQAREGHVLADMDCSTEIYYPARSALIEADLIVFDEETETVYVRRWFKHCRPMNDKHAVGTRRLIADIESDTIREMVELDFEEAESHRKGGKPNLLDSPTPYSSALENSWLVKGNGYR